MPEESENKNKNSFVETVRKKSTRKIRSRKEGDKGLWYGLGMFGLVGWSVSIPTILFLLLGIWIDSTYKSSYSWTLMMLVFGIFIGCMNAWYWVKKESKGE